MELLADVAAPARVVGSCVEGKKGSAGGKLRGAIWCGVWQWGGSLSLSLPLSLALAPSLARSHSSPPPSSLLRARGAGARERKRRGARGVGCARGVMVRGEVCDGEG